MRVAKHYLSVYISTFFTKHKTFIKSLQKITVFNKKELIIY